MPRDLQLLCVIVEDAKLLFSSFVAHARLCCSCKLVVPAKGRGRAGDRLAGGRLATYNLFNLMLSKIRFNWWGSAWSPLGLCCGSLEPRCLARAPWSPCPFLVLVILGKIHKRAIAESLEGLTKSKPNLLGKLYQKL